MNKTSLSAARSLEVILPVGLIVAGSFAGIDWLGTAGAILLGIVLARALLRDHGDSALSTVRGFSFAVAALVVTGVAMVALLVVDVPDYVVIACLAAGVVAVYAALGYIVWWLVRLNNA